MNQDVLNGLANGVVTSACPMPIDPAILAALAASVQAQRTVTTIAAPTKTSTIDLANLVAGTDNRPQFTFDNASGVPATYWFSPYLRTAGDAIAFGAPGNSADDLPAAGGSGPIHDNGGSDKYAFNTKAYTNPGGFVIGKVQITTSIVGTQQRQPLLIFNTNVQNDPCTARSVAPICDACNNNNNSTTFTANFNGPFGVGGNSSIGYVVQDGQSVTVELWVIGQGVGQYTGLGNGTTC